MTPQDDLPEHCMFHYPGATPAAPLDDMDMELPKEDPDPVMDDADMPDSSTLPLSSVGDQQQTLGTGPPMASPMEPSTLGSASADPDRWV